MTFDAFIETAWSDHGDRPDEVAIRLRDSVGLIETQDNAAAYVRLAVHVYGEHLGRWSEGVALVESIGLRPEWNANPQVAGAIKRGTAALRFAGGERAALDGLSSEDRVAVLAMASSAFAGRNDFRRAISTYAEATLLAEAGLSPGSPAFRALAVGGNNLAAGLEEKRDRDAAETAGMIAAAEGALKYWKLAGTWLEEERAEYRLARSLLQAGKPQDARRRALRCVDICTANHAPPFEQLLGHVVLAVAHREGGDRDAFDVSRRLALRHFESIEADERQWCEAALKELGS